MSNANLPDYLKPHDAECVTRLVSECLRRGYTISVHDGEEWAVERSTDPAVIYPAIASTDMDLIRVHGGEGGVTHVGTFYLVWGNGPGETICDYTADVAGVAEDLFDYANKPWG